VGFLMLQRTNLSSPTIDCLPQYVAEDLLKVFRLGNDSSDDAPEISAGIRENTLNIC
jgi:hypothetical protein